MVYIFLIFRLQETIKWFRIIVKNGGTWSPLPKRRFPSTVCFNITWKTVVLSFWTIESFIYSPFLWPHLQTSQSILSLWALRRRRPQNDDDVHWAATWVVVLLLFCPKKIHLAYKWKVLSIVLYGDLQSLLLDFHQSNTRLLAIRLFEHFDKFSACSNLHKSKLEPNETWPSLFLIKTFVSSWG